MEMNFEDKRKLFYKQLLGQEADVEADEKNGFRAKKPKAEKVQKVKGDNKEDQNDIEKGKES